MFVEEQVGIKGYTQDFGVSLDWEGTVAECDIWVQV